MQAGIFFLSGCESKYYSFCPAYPTAGQKVAEELEFLDYETYSGTWEWIGRIDKLRQELELCR